MASFLLRRASSQPRNRVKSKTKHVMKRMKRSFKKLRTDMAEISEEHNHIRKGQAQVKKKFEAIEFECEALKRETEIIIKQSARTQIKLALMFRILKSREAKDFATAANLTAMLREIVGMENEEREGKICCALNSRKEE